MSSLVQSLAGRMVYVRLTRDPTPIPRSLAKLTGEGNLFARPNDVVAGKHSKWTHQSASLNRFETFGKTTKDVRTGRLTSATCVLTLPFGWWAENERALFECHYAQIGYKLGTDATVHGVYAGLFLFTKKIEVPGFDSSRQDGEELLRYEFSCSGGVVRVRPP